MWTLDLEAVGGGVNYREVVSAGSRFDEQADCYWVIANKCEHHSFEVAGSEPGDVVGNVIEGVNRLTKDPMS